MDLWIVDVDSQDKRLLLKFSPSVAFAHQFLPYFDQYALSHRIWSPDSDALIIPILEEGVSHIAVVRLDREEIDVLSTGEIAFWSQQ
jgi:TolB protein